MPAELQPKLKNISRKCEYAPNGRDGQLIITRGVIFRTTNKGARPYKAKKRKKKRTSLTQWWVTVADEKLGR